MKPTIPRTPEAWGLSVPVLTQDQARAARMKPVTYAFPYKEAASLAVAARQLNGIPCAAVLHKNGMELWRKK